jgi:hypothetical protein
MKFSISSDQIVRKKTTGISLLLLTYLHRLTQFQIGADSVMVYQLFGNVEINLSKISHINRLYHDLLKKTTTPTKIEWKKR